MVYGVMTHFIAIFRLKRVEMYYFKKKFSPQGYDISDKQLAEYIIIINLPH